MSQQQQHILKTLQLCICLAIFLHEKLLWIAAMLWDQSFQVNILVNRCGQLHLKKSSNLLQKFGKSAKHPSKTLTQQNAYYEFSQEILSRNFFHMLEPLLTPKTCSKTQGKHFLSFLLSSLFHSPLKKHTSYIRYRLERATLTSKSQPNKTLTAVNSLGNEDLASILFT